MSATATRMGLAQTPRESLMKCPKCSFEQPVGLECIRCGIVFSKYTKTQKQALLDLAEQADELSETRPLDMSETPATFAREAPAPDHITPIGGTSQPAPPNRTTAPGGTAPPPPSSPVVNTLDQQVRPALKYMRLTAGLLAIMFGSLLFWAGEAVSPEPIEALLLIIYLCVGAFWVLSVTLDLTVRRFSMEMLLFVVVTLAIRLTSPDLFDPGKFTRGLSAPPMLGGGGMQAEKTKTSPAQFKHNAWDLNRKTRMLIAGELKVEEQWTEMVTTLKLTYRGLPAADRDRLEPNYRASIALEKAVNAWKTDPTSEAAEAVYTIIEEIDTF